MEVLILSCGMGGGHNSAAYAVAEELRRRGHGATFLNVYDLKGDRTAEAVNNAYIRVAQRAPHLFGAVYLLGEGYRRLPLHSPVSWANGKMARYLAEYLRTHPCDAVVASHMFPAQTLTKMKTDGFPLPVTIFIATDYTCSPFEEESDCDYTVIPSAALSAEFRRFGFREKALLPFGIPVARAFAEDTPRREARERLGWDADATVVVLSGGSIGAGKIAVAIRELRPFLAADSARRLVVICGSNAALFALLRRRYAACPQITLLRHTDRMADFLHGCDVFVSKPGGLSSTEAAAVGVPLIHIPPIPGCETHNIRFFSERGMSLAVKNLRCDLLPAVERLLLPEEAEKMRRAQRETLDRFSAARLCDFLERSVRS